MQPSSAYVEQIPANVRPLPSQPPALRVAPLASPMTPSPPPPGLYVQVASVLSQEQAVRVGVELAQRLGPDRPRFIRAEPVKVAGVDRLRLYAGPFADAADLKQFCAKALPQEACLPHVFAARPSLREPGRPERPTAGGRGGAGG